MQLPSQQLGDTDRSEQQLSDVAAGVSIEDSGASWASWPSLQHLQLRGVWLESVTSLLQLTAAPQLTSLALRLDNFADLEELYSGPHKNTEAAVRQLAAAVPAMLQRLPRLVVLELPGMPFTDVAVQQLAAMQGLRQVSLSHMQHALACDLQRLPSSITRLWYYNEDFSVREPGLPPQLQQLTGLLQLTLLHCALPPTLLGSVTQLQILHMAYATPLPNGDAEGAEALLAVLSKLARLQDLDLESVKWDPVGIAPQRFSALTASSHLTRLAVESYSTAPLPEGAVRHLFPMHRRQPQLRHLQVRILYWFSTRNRTDIASGCIDSADLASIVSCCPALQHLDIACTVQPGADLSVLLQLPDSCTSLAVGDAAFSDAAAATVAQLTQLKHLSWCCSQQLTDTGLEQLTALELDRVTVSDCRLSIRVHDPWRDPWNAGVRLARDPHKVRR